MSATLQILLNDPETRAPLHTRPDRIAGFVLELRDIFAAL